MALSRRHFLKLIGGTGAGAVILSACRPQVQDFLIQSPVRMPEDMVTGVDNWYASRCAQCSAGCGVVVRIVEGRAKKVEGNPEHPLNMGKLCLRGHGSVQEVYHADRIRRPMMAEGGRGSGRFQEVSWERAMEELVGRLKQAQGAGQAVVLATDPLEGDLALVASRFAGAFRNGAHANYEPMDQTVLSAAIKKVFGAEQLPDFDIANARSVLSFGADFLMGWVSQVRHSLAYGDFRQGVGRERGYFIHVDTRFSGTAANADEWVPVKPGSEGKLALSIAYVIVHEGKGDVGAAASLFGPDPEQALAPFKPEAVSSETGVAPERIHHIAMEFANRQPGIALGGGAAGAQTNGLFNLSAIYALNHLVGSVGKKGGIVLNPLPFLAADTKFRNVPVGRYAVTPLAEWERLLEAMRTGEVNTLLVRGADPLFGLPAALRAKDALDRVPFIASFSSFLDDTTSQADLVLPGHLPLEDWGVGTSNPGPGFQAMTFQQPVIRPFLETRGFADVLLDAAQQLGLEADLPWPTFRDLVRESALKLFQSGRGGVPALTFEGFWNETLRKGGWWDEQSVGAGAAAVPRLDLHDPGASFQDKDAPYALVPFQPVGIADGRSAHLPWMQGAPDPITTATWTTWVEMNSVQAREQGLKEGDVIRVETGGQVMDLQLYPNPALPYGVLAVPVGQGHVNYGRYADKFGTNVFHRLAPLKESATGAHAWAANRARITATGERQRIPKLEGTVVPIDFEGHVKVMKG